MSNILYSSVNKVIETLQSSGQGTDVTAEELIRLVRSHAAGAAAASLASAIPGAGGVAALAANVGFIWSMYYRVTKRLGIPLGKQMLKSIGSAVLSNISASIIAEVAATTVFSMLPGVGTVVAVGIAGVISYYAVYYAGVIFMNLLVRLFKVGADIQNMGVDDLKQMQKQITQEIRFKDVKAEARSAYRDRKADGVAEVIEDADTAKVVTRPDHDYELHVAIDYGSTNSVMGCDLYAWNDGAKEWALSRYSQNYLVSFPTIVVYKEDNPDNPNVEEKVYAGKATPNLVDNLAMPAVARTHFKPLLYEQDTARQLLGRKLTLDFFRYLYAEFRRDVYNRLPKEILPKMRTTLHLTTPVRAQDEHVQIMRQIAQAAGFNADNGISFIDTSRNEADCIKYLACKRHPEVIGRLNNVGTGREIYLLFIDVGGSTTDIELVRQSAIDSFNQKGETMRVLAMWPKSMVERPLGGCEVDQAISAYLVREGFLLADQVRNGWEHGNAATMFRQFKETNNSLLKNGMNVTNLGGVKQYRINEETDDMAERKFNANTPITPQLYEQQICADYIDRMANALRDVFSSTGVSQEQVDAVFVTGAGSRLYFLHRLLMGELGSTPLHLRKIQENPQFLFDNWDDPAACCTLGALTNVLTV